MKEFELHDFGWYISKLFPRPINCSTRPEKKAVDVTGTKLFVTARHREGVYLSYVDLWPSARTWWHHSLGLFSHCAVRLEERDWAVMANTRKYFFSLGMCCEYVAVYSHWEEVEKLGKYPFIVMGTARHWNPWGNDHVLLENSIGINKSGRLRGITSYLQSYLLSLPLQCNSEE